MWELNRAERYKNSEQEMVDWRHVFTIFDTLRCRDHPGFIQQKKNTTKPCDFWISCRKTMTQSSHCYMVTGDARLEERMKACTGLSIGTHSFCSSQRRSQDVSEFCKQICYIAFFLDKHQFPVQTIETWQPPLPVMHSPRAMDES